MRRALALFAILLASGARGQTLAEQVVGDWVRTDSIAYPVVDENGAEQYVDEDGNALFSVLYMHVSLTDSSFTSTTVYRDRGDVRGSETTWPYEIRNGQIWASGQPPVTARVDGDSLVLSRPDAWGVSSYTRTGPLTPPETLLGTWITGPMTDDAGVVFDLPFRFRADGTALIGASDQPLAYRVLGPYLLVYDTEFLDPVTGAVTQLFRVSVLDEQSNRVVLHGLADETMTLYRRR